VLQPEFKIDYIYFFSHPSPIYTHNDKVKHIFYIFSNVMKMKYRYISFTFTTKMAPEEMAAVLQAPNQLCYHVFLSRLLPLSSSPGA
jgi:hypothetical protein